MLPTTRTTSREPVTLSRRLFPDIDYLFDDFFTRPTASRATWRPATDLNETDDEFVMRMDLPGFDHDDIELTVEKNILTVSGRRTSEEVQEETDVHLRERSSERFSRSFALPRSVEAGDVEARFANGVLTVHLPKAAEAKPRKIEVKG
jgi:HSP20 family protein